MSNFGASSWANQLNNESQSSHENVDAHNLDVQSHLDTAISSIRGDEVKNEKTQKGIESTARIGDLLQSTADGGKELWYGSNMKERLGGYYKWKHQYGAGGGYKNYVKANKQYLSDKMSKSGNPSLDTAGKEVESKGAKLPTQSTPIEETSAVSDERIAQLKAKSPAFARLKARQGAGMDITSEGGATPMEELQQRGFDPASLGHEGEVFMNPPEQVEAPNTAPPPPVEPTTPPPEQPTGDSQGAGNTERPPAQVESELSGANGGQAEGTLTQEKPKTSLTQKASDLTGIEEESISKAGYVGGKMLTGGLGLTNTIEDIKNHKLQGDNWEENVGDVMTQVGAVGDIIGTAIPVLEPISAGISLLGGLFGLVGHVVDDFKHKPKKPTPIPTQSDDPAVKQAKLKAQQENMNQGGQMNYSQLGLVSSKSMTPQAQIGSTMAF